MPPATIARVRASSVDIPLHTAFGIASGAVETAEIAIVEVTLADGTVGLGEAAPFTAVNGETRGEALAALESAGAILQGHDVTRWRAAAALVQERFAETPSAVCALETALLDAFTRRAGISLWQFFGAAEPRLTTDITVVTGTTEASARFAAHAFTDGFSTLKIKVGGRPIEEDVTRLVAISEAAPGAEWILDGNAAFSAEEAVDLVARIGTNARRIVLFEQPTPATDLEGLRRVHERTGLPIAADESARTPEDVERIVAARAAQVVNVKITKSGVLRGLDIVFAAKALGLELMIGGMVESALAMSMSACIAGGIGGFRYVDLDTPLFMKDSPMVGGYRAAGPELLLDRIPTGHGVSLREA